MDNKLIVRQRSNNDCASACLLSVMKYYGLSISLDEVSFVLKITNSGTNAFNIINGSRTFGFDGYGISVSYDEIINNNVNFPIICHVLKNNYYHFIVVYKVKKNKIEIMDPSSNITKVSKEYFKNIYLNTSLVIFPIKELKKINKYNSVHNYIFDYLKLEKKSIIKILILSFITIIFGFLTSYYLLISIDLVLPKYNHNKFFKISFIFLLIYIFKNIITFIRNKLIINSKSNLYFKMNIDIIRKLFTLPYQYFKSKSTGEVESRINDIKEFRNIIYDDLISLILNLIFIIISSIILFIISKNLFIVLIIEIIIYLLIVLIFKKINNIKIEETLISNDNYNKILNDSINSYEINKNLNLINETIKLLEINNNSLLFKNKSYEKSKNIEDFLKNTTIDIFYLITIYISIIYVKLNYLTLGELFLFNTIIFYLIEPIRNISNLSHDYIYIKDIYNRINDLFWVKNPCDKYDYNEIKENIYIKNLSYSFNSVDNLFDKVNLTIKYGNKYLIYGSSGSGKSTLMKITLKYLDSYKGEIYIGNINLKDISSYNISYNFTYVSQNSYLFHDTIKNNIIYYRSISDKDYYNMIKICNLENLINSKKERNNFIIEDNGFNISGGERQKIILARSLLKSSNYIILDEALSEVGLDEEIEIIKKLFDIYKDKTIIYISHKKEIISLFKNKYQMERRNIKC